MAWDWLMDPLSYAFMQRALITSVLVGIICAVMGSYLVVKRWALLGDAISHAVLPGLVLAYALGLPFFIGAVASGLLTALGIGFIERNTRIKSDAAMGIMFIGAFALGLALLSRIRGHVDIFHILFGNVLGVRDLDLWLAAATGAVVIGVVALFYKELLAWAFDPTMARVMGLPVGSLHYLMMLLLSVSIVASLQAVGIVLVIAMLITPASTAFLLTKRFGSMLAVSVGFGTLAAVFGLYISYYLDIASGAAMVLVGTALFVLTMLFSPQEGLIWRELQRRRRARRIADEDALKAIYELELHGTTATQAALASAMQIQPRAVTGYFRRLRRRGLIEPKTAGSLESARLTKSGIGHARQLVRAHRLWERFLTDEAGRSWDLVHEEAHGLEHFTSKELAEQLAERLGHPQHDPHGAPIPSATADAPSPADQPLVDVAADVKVQVSRIDDENPRVLRTLARLGIKPGTKLTKLEGTNGRVGIQIDGEELEIDSDAAAHVRVKVLGQFPPAT